MPVVELTPEVSAAQAIEIEREGRSVGESIYSFANKVKSTSRLWLRLIAKRSGESFEHVVSHWHSAKQFLPLIEAMYSDNLILVVLICVYVSQCFL